MKNKLKIIGLISLTILILLSSSCGNSSESMVYIDDSADIESVDGYDKSYLAKSNDVSVITTDDESYYAEPLLEVDATVQRMIVRNGEMELLVEDIDNALTDIQLLADNLGGYVVSTQRWQDDNVLKGSIAIRIPAESYDEAVTKLKSLAAGVKSMSSTTKDVTSEYVDLSSQLKSLKATEEQLLAIMEKAETVQEVLAVQSELTDIQEQIEVITGQMKYLEQTAATSLITISLSQSKLAVSFSASSVNTDNDTTVYFDPTVYGGTAPYTFKWDFGDGETSSSEYAYHTYEKSGTYTVKLTVSDDDGNTCIETREDYITVEKSEWDLGGAIKTIWKIFLGFLKVLVYLLIAIVIFSPIWGGIWFIVHIIRKQCKKRKANKDF